MEIRMIIDELIDKEILKPNKWGIKPLVGGTSSRLYVIKNEGRSQIVIKLNDPLTIKSEAHFLHFYKDSPLLPDLIYTQSDYHYIVYPFISGTDRYAGKNKKELLQLLVEQLINHYSAVSSDFVWGWADEAVHSWEDFLLSRLMESKERLASILEEDDFKMVLHLIKQPRRYKHYEPFLLHGDCGVHNFLFKDGNLNGIIDPTPVFGPPIYDLIYAFCSSPDDLTKDIIEAAAAKLKWMENIDSVHLYEEVLIGLYFRLATCVMHHPSDLKEYVNAWDYWKKIINNS